MISIDMDQTTIFATTTTLLAITAAGLYAFLKRILYRLQQKKPFDTLPMPPNSHAVMGHFQLMTNNKDPAMPKISTDIANEQGRTGFWLGNRRAMTVTHWDDARAILQAESSRLAPGFFKRHLGRTAGPNSILLLNGREWKIHRAAINKAFTPAALKAYRDAMKHVTETVVHSIQQRIEQGGSFQMEMEPLMKMITLDVFGLAAFSYDFGCCHNLKTSPLAAAFDQLSQDSDYRLKNNPLKPTHYFYCLPTERNRQRKVVEDLVRSFVKQCTYDRASMKHKPNDLLTLLMETLEHDHKGEIGNDVLDDIILTVLFAGYDTTSITLSYTMHVLSQNPDVAHTCVDEVRAVGSVDKVEELAYCKAVIQEALRYYPPASNTTRTLMKPVQLPDGFVIPAGTTTIIPIWAIHHNEINFPRPDEFLPERWAQPIPNQPGKWQERDPNKDTGDETVVAAGNPKAFFAFSSGGRSCPGQKFAQHEAVVALAGLVEAFEFQTLPGYQLQPQRKVLIQHPHDQLPMIITKRSD